MSKSALRKYADELEEMATKCESIMTELQTVFDDLSEPQQEGDKGTTLQSQIDVVELAKDALDAAAMELRPT
jgi:hypothetical protein